MKFGSIAVNEAVGTVLAHRTGAFKKGRILSASDIAELVAANISQVVAARLESSDVPEDVAAGAIARKLAGRGVQVQAAFTGRSNLYASRAGLIQINASQVNAVNCVDESLTLATLPNFTRVEARQMIATVKVIPFAAPQTAVQSVLSIIADQPLLTVAVFKPFRVDLIITQLPHSKTSLIAKSETAMRNRIEALGGSLARVVVCDHTEAAVAHELMQSKNHDNDFTLVFGASAIVDRGDIIPAAVVKAGGEVQHLGMPVDPGNLLMLAELAGRPVIGVPSCARSPKVNGFDWVLERLACGIAVTAADVKAMGVGGLLAEIQSRPSPRETTVKAPVITAIVLAAGLSRRMGSNKLLAEFGGKTIVRHTVERVLQSSVDRVVVITGHDAEKIRAALDGLAVTIVHNPNFADGQSTSITMGVSAASGCDGVLVCLGDMPRTDPLVIDRLIAGFNPTEHRSILVPSNGGELGNPVLWGSDYFEQLLRITGDKGARSLMSNLVDDILEIAVEDDSIHADVDTPEALAALQQF